VSSEVFSWTPSPVEPNQQPINWNSIHALLPACQQHPLSARRLMAAPDVLCDTKSTTNVASALVACVPPNAAAPRLCDGHCPAANTSLYTPPLTHLATSLTWKSFEPKLLELKLSLLQASLKSKPPIRDLSQLLSDPFDLQAKHFTNDLCVFVTLRDSSPRRIRCPARVTKVVVSFKKFVLPSPSWGFDIGRPN
jgi:hypothetical protein